MESASGLVTLRAFGWTTDFVAKSRRLLDASQKPYYLLLSVQRWLVFVLNLVVAALAILIMGMAIALRSKLNAGFLGLAFVHLMSLSLSLTNLVQQWTLLETSLGAIARIKDFSTNTPTDDSAAEVAIPDASWPSRGALRFENVCASYQ
jgi:ATP-binding cassette, subfamily C (CFTR/MRP), member 1